VLRGLIGALSWAFAVEVSAQGLPAGDPAPAARSCASDTITTIGIRSRPATSTSGNKDVRATSRVVRLWFATTRPSVVRSYLRVKAGDVCTEFNRSESERLLRAQPFIAAASVHAIPDGPGRVRIDVDVTDELPIVADGGLRNGKPAFVSLGTLNFRGLGLAVSATGTRGFAYRDGFGLDVVQYGAFKSPYFVAASAERNPVGSAWSVEFAAPFLSALQRRAFRVGGSDVTGYSSAGRATGPDVSLKSHRTSYSAGWVTRIGTLDRRRTAGFVGGALLGESIRTDSSATIVSDTGFVRAPDVMFGAEYPSFEALRVAAIGGLRAVRFLTVHGFDALRAQQDVGVGIQVHLLAGPSVWATTGRNEIFAAGDLYAGVGGEAWFLSAHVVGEARGVYDSPSWDGMVGSARLSWYGKPSPNRTRTLSAELGAIRHIDFPAQLTFRDPEGGVAGFADSRAAGGARAVVRVEERRLFGLFRSRADFAVAAFSETGKLWAGDAPYGQTTIVRSSVGLSLLGAYPSGGKRTYRLDVAVPLNPERGGSRIEVRVSAVDRTRLLWAEPRDLARVRTGAVPATLLRW